MAWQPEDLTSQIDGVTDTFTTTFQRVLGQIQVHYNGNLLDPVSDFTEPSSKTIELTFVPTIGNSLHVDYLNDETVEGRVVGSAEDPGTGPVIPQSLTDLLDDFDNRIDALETAGPAPGPHAGSHQHLGTDEVATAAPAANAIPKADAAGDLDAWISTATEGAPGISEIATQAEVDTAVDDARFVTSLKLATTPRLPTQDENDACVGTSGVPSSSNEYVTDADPRNADARTPVAHAASHQHLGVDEVGAATPAANVIPKTGVGSTLADGFISESSVTQHEGAIDHDALLNYVLGQHRVIDDVGTGATDLWSASKIDGELSALLSGIDIKAGVDTTTKNVGNVVLSGEQTLNGLLTSTSRVLVTDQTAPAENGIYVSAPGAWARSSDADQDAEVTNGNIVHVVNSGSAKYKYKYLLVTPDPIVVGTTAQTWEEHPDVEFGTTGGTATEGNDSRVPTQNENDALVGTVGTPSTANPYVTAADSRLRLYDAVVAADGSGDYLDVNSAITAGALSIFVKNGAYLQTGWIDLPDGGVLIGESKSGVVFDCQGVLGNGLRVHGSPTQTDDDVYLNGVTYGPGDIDVTKDSAIVDGSAGVPTLFQTASNPVSAGEFLIIRGAAYEIASVDSDTQLTLALPYRAASESGIAFPDYVIQPMKAGVTVSDVTFRNVAHSVTQAAVQLNMCLNGTLRNIDVSESVSLTGRTVEFRGCVGCLSTGLTSLSGGAVFGVRNSWRCSIVHAALTGARNNGVFFPSSTNGLPNIKHSVLGISLEGVNNGINLGASAADCIVANCNISNCENDGIKWTRADADHLISGNAIRNAAGTGIVAGGAGCVVGNDISGSGTYGIELNADDVRCLRNLVTLSGVDGLRVASGLDRVFANYNVVGESGGWGIFYVGTAPTNGRLMANVFQANALGDVNVIPPVGNTRVRWNDDVLDNVVAGTPVWKKYTVSHTALQAAGTSNDVEVYSLQAAEVIHAVKLKHSVSFGGGAIASYTASIGIVGDLVKYAAALDVFQAVGDTVQQLSSVVGTENHGAATSIRIAAVSTGANLDASTAGSVDVWILASRAS